MKWATRFVLAGLLAAGSAMAGEGFEPVPAGRELTEAFHGGETYRIWSRFDESMRQGLGSKEQLAAFREQIRSQLGAESEVIDEEVIEQQGFQIYRRLVRFEKVPMLFRVQWAFDAQGRVAGFYIRRAQKHDAAPTDHGDYRTKTKLRLPFDGDWYVFWGGRTIEQNYHAATVDQRFAYDFLVRRDGGTHREDGEANSDYFCWDAPVLAPAPGLVVVAEDGLEDNRPGQMDLGHPPGNFVVLDHGNGEYSFLAHLRNGSVTVEEGDRVEAGQKLGSCGNSGNSSEPHLHYHLQTTARFGAGNGLPAEFTDFVADQAHVDRGIPVRGQYVSPATGG